MNLALALVWAALWGSFSLPTLLAGFLVGYLVLLGAEHAIGGPGYTHRVGRALLFAGFFLVELAKSNVRVAYDVLTPRHHMRPAIVAVPLDLETDAEITMLANLITLTPGTLSLDVSADRRTLYVHAMYVDDPQETVRSIKEGFERRVREVMR